MAKKNRYKVENTNNKWEVRDASTQVMDTKTLNITAAVRYTTYTVAQCHTEEDAKEIATALNYYNNRDKD